MDIQASQGHDLERNSASRHVIPHHQEANKLLSVAYSIPSMVAPSCRYAMETATELPHDGAGNPAGRLLDLPDHEGCVSLGELDGKLRAGIFDIRDAIPVWQSEVTGFVEKNWGSSYRRFQVIVVAGGGARILREGLLMRFKDRAVIPDDPIIATARGLYKYTLMQARRKA